jgi:hypothetical protein
MKLQTMLDKHAANLAGLNGKPRSEYTLEELQRFAKARAKSISSYYRPVTEALLKVHNGTGVREALEEMFLNDAYAMLRARNETTGKSIALEAGMSMSAVTQLELDRLTMISEERLLKLLVIYAKHELETFGGKHDPAPDASSPCEIPV